MAHAGKQYWEMGIIMTLSKKGFPYQTFARAAQGLRLLANGIPCMFSWAASCFANYMQRMHHLLREGGALQEGEKKEVRMMLLGMW